VKKEGVKPNCSGNSSQTLILKRPFFIASYIDGDTSSQSQLSLREDGCKEARNKGCIHKQMEICATYVSALQGLHTVSTHGISQNVTFIFKTTALMITQHD
jgi:hypothetical protein